MPEKNFYEIRQQHHPQFVAQQGSPYHHGHHHGHQHGHHHGHQHGHHHGHQHGHHHGGWGSPNYPGMPVHYGGGPWQVSPWFPTGYYGYGSPWMIREY